MIVGSPFRSAGRGYGIRVYMMKILKFSSFLAVILLFNANAWTDCAASKSEIKTIMVKECRVIDPENEVALKKEVNRVFKGTDAKRIFATYEGMLISSADGNKYFYPNKNKTEICPNQNAKLKISVEQACCDGDPNPPC